MNVFQWIGPQLVSNIKFVSIFGFYSNDVLFVTKDEKVLAFGTNKLGCLGFGTMSRNSSFDCLLIECQRSG